MLEDQLEIENNDLAQENKLLRQKNNDLFIELSKIKVFYLTQ